MTYFANKQNSGSPFTQFENIYRVHSMEFKILQLQTPTEFPASPLVTALHSSYSSDTELRCCPNVLQSSRSSPKLPPMSGMLAPCPLVLLINPRLFCKDLLKCPFFGSLLPMSPPVPSLFPQLLAIQSSGKGTQGL